MDFRLATPADGPRLETLLAAQLEEHGLSLPRADLRRAMAGVFESPSRGAFVVASDPRGIHGVAYLSYNWTLEHGGRCAWLEELYVSPALRNAGLGAELLGAALEVAQAQGCRAVDLEVDANHARAMNLYERKGFRRLTRTRFTLPLAARPAGRES